MTRTVTERDLRSPEFKEGAPDDYEFRADGKIVRKDRWEQGIYSINHILNKNRDFEIADLVAQVRRLADEQFQWTDVTYAELSDFANETRYDIQLPDSSILKGVTWSTDEKCFKTQIGQHLVTANLSEIALFRHHTPLKP